MRKSMMDMVDCIVTLTAKVQCVTYIPKQKSFFSCLVDVQMDGYTITDHIRVKGNLCDNVLIQGKVKPYIKKARYMDYGLEDVLVLSY